MIYALRRFLALLLIVVSAPALAQPQPDPLQQRADDVARVLRGETDPATVFSPAFLAQVPPAQIRAISGQLTAANGALRGIENIDRGGPHSGTIHVGFERAVVSMRMDLTADPPHLIQGLIVTGSEPRGGDSAEAVLSELRSLPGQVSFQIARLGEGATSIAAHQPNSALAIGSTFKLIILAELGRQIEAGQRRWQDVIPIDRHSLPSGILQDFPLGAPVTVHTAASLMISRSDNTATDMLLRLVGRENVEAMMNRMGMSSAARNRPFLATIEAFRLKADSAEARSRWIAADEAGRRRLLHESYGESGSTVDVARLFGGGPNAIDTIEWFASSSDLVKVMDWLRRHGGETVHSVMAILPGMSPDTARRFAYVGFKGGSEPGVINLTYLIRNNAGQWHVVTGSWNNPAAAVDEARFAGLMGRAVNLVR